MSIDGSKINDTSKQEGELVDYYTKYGIGRNESWETIRIKLSKEMQKWMRRQSSANDPKVLAFVNQQIDEISDAMILFKPGHEEERKQYDARLEQQKQRQESGDNTEVRRGKISVGDIESSLRHFSRSIQRVSGIQKQRTGQMLGTRKAISDALKHKSTDEQDVEDFSK